MGVYEETATRTPGMHWQPHERYTTTGPAYDPSRDLSPNLPPSCGDGISLPPRTAAPATTTLAHSKRPATNSTNNLMNTSDSGSTTNSISGDNLEQNGGGRGNSGHGSPSHSNNNNNNHHHHLSSCGADVCNNNNSASRNNNNIVGGSSSLVELCSYTNRIGSFEQHIPKIEPSTPTSPSPHHHHHHHHHGHSLPLPPPPSHLYDGLCICAGCGLKIADRFYLQAIDRRWHAACLQCCQCKYALDGERTCFSREGNIYCRKDYYRQPMMHESLLGDCSGECILPLVHLGASRRHPSKLTLQWRFFVE